MIDFHRNRKLLLYQFYLAAYQVLLGFYPDIILQDQLPIHTLKTRVKRIIQDFVATFYQFLKINYQLKYTEIDSQLNTKLIRWRSRIIKNVFVGHSKKDYPSK